VKRPKVTFGIIVLNGEPFTRYCLRALYPYAHEIIVAEGACEGARAVATPDGHSRDGTLDVLRQFKLDEDPEGKVQIVTAEDEGHPNGFWPGEKHEQSQAYAKRATGHYLWQVDIDEFYMPGDMERVLKTLHTHSDITAMSFKQIQFWGGLDYFVDSWYLRRLGEEFHRLFKWKEGYRYITHRPPTVVTDCGIDTRDQKWLDAYEMESRDIRLYHYSFILPKQVREKAEYYGASTWAKRPEMVTWAQKAFFELEWPFHVHSVYDSPAWLERYDGNHPPQIIRLMEDIEVGCIDVELRATGDIDALIDARWYRLGRMGLKMLEPFNRYLHRSRLVSRLRRLRQDPVGVVHRKLFPALSE